MRHTPQSAITPANVTRGRVRTSTPSISAASDAGIIQRHYFFFPEPKLGCHPAVFWLGAAAIVLIFSFLGFLDSRLPFCSPLAMSLSLSSSTH
jgi:hypothetical protein